MLTYDKLVAAFRECGLEKGDVVHIQGNLRRIGPVDTAPERESILEFYLSAIQEVIRPEGTLSVLTPFFDYGRYGTPFIREETPSQGGVFSEYIRTRPGAVRSLHPIFSLTALGHLAEDICGKDHYSSYGWHSPWTELYKRNAKIIALGLGTNPGGTTIIHYIENLYGVPYQYNRLLTDPVFSNGMKVEKPFCISVRYMDYEIAYDTQKVKKHLVDLGKARLVKFGNAQTFSSTALEMIESGLKFLDDDIYSFLTHPPLFIEGKIPKSCPTKKK